jgi:hypothetical protein
LKDNKKSEGQKPAQRASELKHRFLRWPYVVLPRATCRKVKSRLPWPVEHAFLLGWPSHAELRLCHEYQGALNLLLDVICRLDINRDGPQ